MTVVLMVSGSRHAVDPTPIETALDEFHAASPIAHLHHGGARGVDSIAHQWALRNNVPVTSHPADWSTYGRSAGPIRNRAMLDEAKPDYWIAFPADDSRGTVDFMNAAFERDIPGTMRPI